MIRSVRPSGLWWGVLLLTGGLLVLLFNFGVFDPIRPGLEYVIAGIAAATGLGFLAYYARDRAEWWPVLPGLTLLGAGGIVYLSTRGTWSGEALMGLLLIAIAIAFGVVYVANPRNWWAIIPGGILIVVGAVVALSRRWDTDLLGTLLFVGFGLVFLLVYVLGKPKREVWWALIPSAALIVSGFFIYVLTAGQEQIIAKLWPVLAILLGGWLIGRGLSARRRAPSEAAPPQEPSFDSQGAAAEPPEAPAGS